MTLIAGCQNKPTITYQDNIDSNKLLMLFNNNILKEIRINNISNYELYFLHYQDNKLVKKYGLILDENNNKDNLDLIYAISSNLNNDKIKTISFLESNALLKENINFKYNNKYLNTIELKNIDLTKNNKNIISGLYIDDDKASIARSNDFFKDVNKYESLLLILEFK
ncbi:MAG: hypothetical protein LBR40_04375 [Bacilli bacterium]|jgi:hypothetical protein|nr:hypothetical protein [Bacilli bacterium]